MARWLVIGGTRFVGHHIAQAAIDRGHDVTLLHRGETPAALDGSYRELLADRTEGLEVLRGTHWDAVIDVCGYLPKVVAQTLRMARCSHYTFISTVSVYPERPVDQPPIREGDPLVEWKGAPTEEITEHSYGPLKVECEQAVQLRHAGATIIRPGYVVGPRDHTHRFSWWVRRLARSGPVLVPDNAEVPIQVIDARDLAGFVALATARRLPGAYNCVGPATLTWGEVYTQVRALAGVEPPPVAVAEPWLTTRGIGEDALPMWLPKDRLAESLIASGDKAMAAGLILRPLKRTLRDILDEPPPEDVPEKRLEAGREAALLEAWALEGASRDPHAG